MSRFSRLLALACVVAACGDSAGPDAGRNGRYVLRTINGQRLPAVVQETASGRLEFFSGALRLNTDMTFTDSTDLKVTPMFMGAPLVGGEVVRRTDVAWGLYHISGDTVYFDSLRGEHYFMVFQVAGPLNQNLAGAILFYQK